MTKDQLNGATTIDAATYYLTNGLKVVPVPRNGNHKNPNKNGWDKRVYDRKDFVDEQNIGARLGEEVAKDAFLADVDIDMKLADKQTAYPGAAAVAAFLLPDAGWVFGRASAPAMHLMYLTDKPVTTVKYHGVNGATLIELRGQSPNKKAQITIVPPGLHQSREQLRFDQFDPVTFASVKPADLLSESVQHVAVALAILQVWPAVGKRHDARLAFAKVLLERGLSEVVCRHILTAVHNVTGSSVADVAQCVRDTARKDPKDALGAKWVADNLDDGKETLRVIDKILGRKESLPTGSFDVTEIDLKTLTPQVWTRLDDTNQPARRLLQGGLPVRVTHIPANREERNPTWVFQPLDSDRLRHETAQVATFFVRVRDGYKQVVAPRDVLADMLATEPRRIPLPTVTRIVHAPTMAANGDIQLTPGYQAATRTFFVDTGLVIPDVALAPTDADIARAVATIKEPLRDFAFVADADRTAAVAFYLLPFVRSLIDGPTPLHLFKKPVAGAGATLLTDVLLFPAVGSDVARMSTATDDDEWRKRITSTLMLGPAVILIDNVREIVSPQVAKVLTDSTWQDRILGASRNAILQVECVWGATGINPDLHQEVARRIVPCHLDPGIERPWLRAESAFAIPNLREWSRTHRADMIWAALTIARAWHVAGQPAGDRSLGMFEDWARVVGGILKHAGFPDFLANLETLYEDADVEGDAVGWLYEQWHSHHQDKPVRLSEVQIWALGLGSPLQDVIQSQTERGRPMAFAKWVRRLKNRVVEINGHPVRIEPVKSTGPSQRHTWRLAPASSRGLPITSCTSSGMPF